LCLDAQPRGVQCHYDIAIRLRPDLPYLYATKTQSVLRLAGDIAQARAAIESAQRLRLENDPSIAYSRVLLDLYDGNIQEAIKRFPFQSWEALESRGALLQAQIYGQARQPQLEKSYYESAIKMTIAKIQQHPEEAGYHSALGIGYAGLGRKQNAIRDGKTAVDLLPVSKDACRGVSRV
jgi:hypothetical protein